MGEIKTEKLKVQRYSVGFCFAYGKSHVVLIRKNKPDWQRGKLNGVGGHVEKGEKPIECMVREFHEETGVKTYERDWKQFAKKVGTDFEVNFFATANGAAYSLAHTTTEEGIEHWNTSELSEFETVPTLQAMILLARHALDYGDISSIVMKYEKHDPANAN